MSEENQKPVTAPAVASSDSLAQLRFDCRRALTCLYLEAPGCVVDDVNAKVMAYIEELERRLRANESSSPTAGGGSGGAQPNEPNEK